MHLLYFFLLSTLTFCCEQQKVWQVIQCALVTHTHRGEKEVLITPEFIELWFQRACYDFQLSLWKLCSEVSFYASSERKQPKWSCISSFHGWPELRLILNLPVFFYLVQTRRKHDVLKGLIYFYLIKDTTFSTSSFIKILPKDNKLAGNAVSSC